MPRPIQRQTDPNSGGGKVAQTDGNTTVFANNLLASVDTSTVRYPLGRTATANGSGVVFAHNKPVNYTDNADQDGAVRVGGSGNVFVGDDVDQDIPSTRAVIGGDEEEALTPPEPVGGFPSPGQPYRAPAGARPPSGQSGPGDTYFKEKVNNGTISKEEAARTERVQPTGQSSGAAATNKAPTTTDPGDVGTEFPDTLQLSPRFTIGKLTRKPNVAFDHPVSAPNVQGIPTKQIVESLKLLAINTLEPIYDKYPNAFITNTYREDSKTQHGRGQAADIQFRGVSKSEYFNIAKWIRDNVPFDQLLLEYKTTGSGLPWIHVSFKVPQRPTSDPTKVMTFLNDKRESLTPANGYGLVQLAEG